METEASPKKTIAERKAWTGSDLAREDWLMPIPAACLDEISAVIATLDDDPGDIPAIDAARFPMARSAEFATAIRDRLDSFPGFVVLDRLPVAHMSLAQSKAAYWLLSSLIGRPVAQSFDGTRLYDVKDTGRKIAHAVRGDVTNQELFWHTDYGFNRLPPHYIGLLVLATAREGGISQVISFHAAHAEMRRRFPDLLPRLYRPFHWNRQREHAPGETLTYRHPVFTDEGGLRVRFNGRLIAAGYEIAGETFDAEGKAALEALTTVLQDRALPLEFTLEPGQVQFLNNREFCHRRTAYLDHPPPAPRRHLVRIFLRDEGGPDYDG